MTNEYNISIRVIYGRDNSFHTYRAVPDFNMRKMLAFFVIFAFITFVYCSSICESKSCVCWDKHVDNQDFIGDVIQCSYRPDILKSNYTLPDVVHSLDLSSNNISVVLSSSLLKSATMAELLLSNNFIKGISNVTFMLPELKRLDLSYNLLEYIDKESFKGLKKLEYLNLANNRFTSFTNLMFHHLSNLNEIVLNNNNIGGSLEQGNLFDRSGYGLTQKVKSISIGGINIDKVPDNFFVDAYDLRKLIISNNKITDVFEIPYTLEYLDLSGNPISAIAAEDFTDLPALKVLKLNNLLITEVPNSAFEYLHGLKTLELERNRNLSRFSTLAFGQEVLTDVDDFALERLSLKGSRLTQLDEELMEPFGHLAELDLQGNPWQCDCSMKWVKRLQIPEHYTDHLRCGSPTSLYNAKIFELKAKYFVCQTEKPNAGFVVVVFSLSLILASVAVWVFLCLPKRQSRVSLIREMYSPSAAYSVLPISASIDN